MSRGRRGSDAQGKRKRDNLYGAFRSDDSRRNEKINRIFNTTQAYRLPCFNWREYLPRLPQALGNSHYVGTHKVNDVELRKLGIDRIYDIFAYEQKFEATDWLVNDFVMTLPAKSYSSAEFMTLLGEHVEQVGGASDSTIVSAYKHNTPLFVPALCDSSIGLSLYLAKLSGTDVLIDHIEDMRQITDIVRGAESSGVIYVGGGVPKNFMQQTAMAIKIASSDEEDYGHDYAIQFTTDLPQFGGLSGCTFEEAVSWGKVSERAQKSAGVC